MKPDHPRRLDPTRDLPRCPKTHKVGWRSAAALRHHIRDLNQTVPAEVRIPNHIYECPHCGLWHRTKQPQTPKERAS